MRIPRATRIVGLVVGALLLGWHYLMDLLSAIQNVQYAIQHAPGFVSWLASRQGGDILGLIGVAFIVFAFFVNENRRPMLNPLPSAMESNEDTTVEKKLKPNLTFVGSKVKPVYISPFGRDGIRDPYDAESQRQSLTALVFVFENATDANRQVADTGDVIARMKVSSLTLPTSREFAYGVWINSPCNSTSMRVGDTSELFIMHRMDNVVEGLGDLRASASNHIEFSYLDQGSLSGLDILDIVLIDQRSQPTYSHKFKVWWDGGHFASQIRKQ